nr:glycosyltransferase family A protein [uncultured Acetatifactor sp.]
MSATEMISVIVPVYNIKNYVEKCVNSIINQTYQNFEIILVDDGSSDGSEVICDKLAMCDERIRTYHKANGGLSDARNFGIDKSRGKYISFVDGDDLLHPDAIELLLHNLTINKADISSGG